MNTNVRLFDANNKLVDNFDEEIEKILISIHGEDYFDVDEELIDTNAIKLENIEVLEDNNDINDKSTKEEDKQIRLIVNEKAKVKDFIPVLFFALIFAIIVIAGYYFLNEFDFTSFLDIAS